MYTLIYSHTHYYTQMPQTLTITQIKAQLLAQKAQKEKHQKALQLPDFMATYLARTASF